MAEDVNLISLAAWLHHQSEQARASADFDGDEFGARATLETAARLAQAARVVKAASAEQSGRVEREAKAFAADRAGANQSARADDVADLPRTRTQVNRA